MKLGDAKNDKILEGQFGEWLRVQGVGGWKGTEVMQEQRKKGVESKNTAGEVECGERGR